MLATGRISRYAGEGGKVSVRCEEGVGWKD